MTRTAAVVAVVVMKLSQYSAEDATEISRCLSTSSKARSVASRSRIMGKSKQVGNHNSDRHKNISKKWKTKRRTKDLDEIHSDMKPETAAKLLHQEVDYD
ncbi:hypothetical protein CRUP_006287, partial [Coryphaenoides rupestris]